MDKYVGRGPRGPRSGGKWWIILEKMLFAGKFLAIIGPFAGHGWANFQVRSLSLYLPDFLNMFSGPTVGHFWSFWTILSSNFVNLGPRLTIFHRLPDHQGKSRASFEPPTLEFCDCFTFSSLQPLNFATVSHFGAKRPQNDVLSSTLGSGGPKMLYCRQFC